MVLQSRKKLQVFEKKRFFEKKSLAAYLCGYDLQNDVQSLFLNKWFSKCFSFDEKPTVSTSVPLSNASSLSKNSSNHSSWLQYYPLSVSATFCLFSSGIYFSLVLWQAFCLFMPSKRNQNSFTTTREFLDVYIYLYLYLFIVIFLSIVIYSSLFTLNCLY